MSFWFLMMAAALSLLGAFFHGVIGGRLYMQNINSSEMESLTKSLSLVSWHIFTIFLLVSTFTFGYIAYYPEVSSVAYAFIAINLLGAALFIVLGLGNHRVLLKLPGAYLMGGTPLLAWLGVG
ncbi:MAG: hypothetical protein QNK66_10310 [Porticoccaceae bacterium]|jgi:hypothetical protein